MGSTCTTTAVMVPEKSLLFSVVPLPSNLLAWLPATEALPNELPLNSGKAVMPASKLEFLSTLLVERCTALTFSAICTVKVSPTKRAR